VKRLRHDPFLYGDGSALQSNHYTVWQRVRNTLLALALLAYGGLGLYIDDLVLPGKRGRVIHLQGAPKWALFAAIGCAAAVLLALVIDHYDRRHNEHHYDRFKRQATSAGWSFLTVAVLWQVANTLRGAS
jgi:hypothetical protein